MTTQTTTPYKTGENKSARTEQPDEVTLTCHQYMSTAQQTVSTASSTRRILSGEHRVYQSIFEFIKSNPIAGLNQLHAVAYQTYSKLYYDTNVEYLLNEEYLAGLPCTTYQGIAAEVLWQLLEMHGHVRNSHGIQYAPKNLSSSAHMEWAARYRIREGQEVLGRWAELSEIQENELYIYLEARCATMDATPNDNENYSTNSNTVQVETAECVEPDTLYQCASQLAKSVNDLIEAELEYRLTWLQRFPKHNARTRADLIQQIGEYSFHDGVVLPAVTAEHFRPIRFLGILVDIPRDIAQQESLQVRLIYQDQRQPGNKINLKLNETLTERYCLTYGLRELHLSTDYLAWALKRGQQHTQDSFVLQIKAAQLLLAKRTLSSFSFYQDDDLPY